LKHLQTLRRPSGSGAAEPNLYWFSENRSFAFERAARV
jgi:hypothetical protein